MCAAKMQAKRKTCARKILMHFVAQFKFYSKIIEGIVYSLIALKGFHKRESRIRYAHKNIEWLFKLI